MIFCNPSRYKIIAISCLYPNIPDAKPQEPAPLYDMDVITRAVSDYFRLSVNEVKSPSRIRDHSEARCIIYTLIKKGDKNATLKGIGRFFNRDHSTIIHGLETYNDLYVTDKSFRIKADFLTNKLFGPKNDTINVSKSEQLVNQ